jgi:hypothetical protein
VGRLLFGGVKIKWNTNIKQMDEKEILTSSQRYQSNVDASKAAITTFDSVLFLYQVERELKEQKLFLCERRPKCLCKQTHTCLCDSDDYVAITKVKFELASNCAFFCEFTSSTKLNHLKQKNTASPLSTLRFFTLDDEKEKVRLDLVRHKMRLIVDGVRFDVTDIHIQEYVVTIRLNYMSWTNPEKSKLEQPKKFT